MTFTSAVNKSGPITISKAGSGSMTLPPGSPRSPGSPLNGPAKRMSPGSSVKVSVVKKMSVNNVSISSKSLASKSVTKLDAKSESPKVALSASSTKSATKPPPLKLNTKVTDVNGLQPPMSPKSVAKTPTTPSVRKSLVLTKSPIATKSLSASNGLVKTPSSPLIKSSQVDSSLVSPGTKASTSLPKKLTTKSFVVSSPVKKSPPISLTSKSAVSSPVKKSPPISVTSSSVSSPVKKSPPMSVTSKSSAVSSPVKKSPPITVVSKSSAVGSPVKKSPPISVTPKLSAASLVTKPSTSIESKTSTITVSIKSPTTLTKHITSAVKPLGSKTIQNNFTPSTLTQSKTSIAKPTTPVNKTASVSTKSVSGVKLPTMPTNHSSMISRNPPTASSMSLKTPGSPSKLLSKESNAEKLLIKPTVVASKSNAIFKSGPTSPKVMVKKETSTSSLLSTKSTSLSLSKITTSKTKVMPSSVVSKNLLPKSPTAKTSLTATKALSAPSTKKPSPVVKTPMSPTVKAPLSPALTARSPLSPLTRPRTTSLSTSKPPMSPARPKLLPTKLLLSPSKNKLSSSRSSSVSTESLASRASLKSPMSPRPLRLVPKSPSKIIKKVEAPIVKGIRGGQPIKKTIDVLEITESSSNQVDQQILHAKHKFHYVSEEIVESEITQTSDFEQLALIVSNTIVNNKDKLEIPNTFVFDDVSMNLPNVNHVENSLDIQEHNLATTDKDFTVELLSNATPNEHQHNNDNCIPFDFVFVTKDDCVPHLVSSSKCLSSYDIKFDDNHFDLSNENVTVKQCDETQSCIIDVEDHFEPMNDKLVLGDVPFETDSCQSDISDNEHAAQKKVIEAINCEDVGKHSVDDMFSFTFNSSIINLDGADSTENFIHQFMPKSIERSEGASSISTDDGSILSRKSYSEAVTGSPKDGECYFDYGFDLIDDCLDYDDEKPVFVEMTEKQFPELKPKDISAKRRNKKQKKKNFSSRTGSQSGNYNYY